MLINAEIVATVCDVLVDVGHRVAAGQHVVILESMKMEIPVESPVAGEITALHVTTGQSVAEGDGLFVVG